MEPAPTRTRRRRISIGPKLIWRALREDPAVVLSLAAVVLVTSAVVAATPRLLAEVSTKGLRQTVAEAPSLLRNISVGRSSRISNSVTFGPFANVASIGERFVENEMPESLQEIITAGGFVVTSPRFKVSPMPGEAGWYFTALAHLRYEQDVADHVELVAGSFPEPRDPIEVVFPPEERAQDDEDAEELEPIIETLPLFEVAVGRQVLDEFGIGLGTRVLITPDTADRNHLVVPLQQLRYQVVIEVVGVIEPIDPDEPYWYDDLDLIRPEIFANPDFAIITPSLLISPDDYGRLLRATNGALWDYSWRYFVDADRLDPASVGELARDLDDLTFRYRSAELTSLGNSSLTTGLDRLINRYFDQRRSTVSVLTLGLVGVVTTALAVIALLAALISARRDHATHLLRSRGASGRQLSAAALIEAFLISLPAAAGGLFVAVLLVPRQAMAPSWQLAIGVGLAATILMLLGAQGAIRRRLGTTRGEEVIRPPTRGRLVAEIALVAIAVVSVVLARRQTLDTLDAADRAGSDPLLTITPALLALAAGIVVLRLYVYPVRLFARLGARRRDLVAFVGLRRVLQQVAAARLPLLVLSLVATVAALVGSFQLSIDSGQEEVTWHDVGADYRIAYSGDLTPLPRWLDLSSVDSIEASAAGLRFQAVPRTESGRSNPVDVLALEIAEYARVTEGSRAEVPILPDAIGSPSGDGIGSEINPLPAVVSADWAAGLGLEVGDQFTLDLDTVEAAFFVAATLERFPSIALGQSFVVTDFDAIDQLGSAPRQPTAIYVRAPEDAAGRLADVLARQAPAVRLLNRMGIYRSLSEAPLVDAVSRGMGLAFIVSAAFAILAVVGAFALTARARLRQMAYLRTMGLNSRQAIAITVVEQLPPALIAVGAGGVMGAVVAVVLAPSVDLGSFTGPGLPVSVHSDVVGIAAIVAAVSLAVLLATWAFAAATRKLSLGAMLRLGNE